MRCLRTTLSFLEIIARQYPDEYARIRRITRLNYTEESERWRDIIERIYLPEDPERGIFVQNDGYMDKVLQSADAIPDGERPINQYWSWDRILRSCYIKQGDVLLGLYLYYRTRHTGEMEQLLVQSELLRQYAAYTGKQRDKNQPDRRKPTEHTGISKRL